MIPEPPVWEFLGWVVIGCVSLGIAIGVCVGLAMMAGFVIETARTVRAKIRARKSE